MIFYDRKAEKRPTTILLLAIKMGDVTSPIFSFIGISGGIASLL
jgi:hypothetical protein